MSLRPRFGPHLTGDVLEIGPGLVPFPTAPGARIVFADRSVPGGRDRTWPELAGQPSGPQAEYDLDLDVDGLAGIADESLDAVVAAHVLEHLANPVHAIVEMMRVLRPGGRLAIVMPERRVTFDSGREPTPLQHVVEEYRQGVVEVSEAHIAEFCAAIYHQPPIHPDEVRQWHDPDALDEELYALHRRRSIHVHCWNAEEFAALLAGLLRLGVIGGRLVDLYVHDDGAQVDNEYGLLVEKTATGGDALDLARDLVRGWTLALVGDPGRDLGRAAVLSAALARDVGPELAGVPGEVLAERLTAERSAAAERAQRVEAELEAERARVRDLGEQVRAERESVARARADHEAVLASRTFRVGALVAAPVRRLRGPARRLRGLARGHR